MAHGFLTPQAVSGESPISKYFEKKVDQLIAKGVKKIENVAKNKFNQFKDLFSKKRDTTYRSGRGGVEVAGRNGIGENTAKGGGILGGSPKVKGILPASGGLAKSQENKIATVGKNGTDLDNKFFRQKALPTSDPEKPGNRPRKGGSYVNMGGMSSGDGLVNKTNELFSKYAGFNQEEVLQLIKERKITASELRELKRTVQAQSASAAPSVSPDSGADVVAAVNKNTEAIMRMVEVTQAQTSNDSSLVKEQIQAQETMLSRSKARAEETQLEKGSDLSDFLKAERFKKKEKPQGGGGGDDSLFDFLDLATDLFDFGGGGGKRKGRRGGGLARRGGRRKAPPRIRAPRAGGGAPRIRTPKPSAPRPGVPKGGLPKIRGGPKAGPLALLFAGMEFSGRKSDGQSNIQAGLGTAASVGGGIAGAKGGAAAGAAIGALFGGVGAIPGGIIGGILGGIGGSMLAGGAADMATGAFANGGIITKPILSLMGEGNKKEGVFPLEGSEGKKTFQKFGEGLIEAQKSAKDEFSKIQAAGLKFYFQNQDGFKFFGDILKNVFAPFLAPLKALGALKDLGGGLLNSLLGGAANAGGLTNVGGGGTGEQNLAAFLSTMEATGNQNQADAFQVMLNRAADAQAGGSMKAYGTTLGDQVTAREQFSPISSAIYGVSADSAAAAKYGPISRALGSSPAERKKKLLEIASQPDGLAALQKLFGGGSAADAAKVLQDFKSGGALSQKSSSDIGSMVSFRGYKSGSGDFNRGAGGNFFFGQGSKGKVGSLAQVSPGQGPGSPGSAGNLAAAAKQLKGMSTADGPEGGNNGCVYAVNKVFARAGITPPWGKSEYVPDAEKCMIDAGWQPVPYSQQQPGDVFVMKDQKSPPQAHIGVATDNQNILSNSSSSASMSWSETAAGYNREYGGVGTLYRMPGGQAQSTTNASPSTPGTPLTAEQKAQMFKNAGMPSMSADTLTGTTPRPGPISAAPASPQTGTPIMATSAQVASASMHGAGPTVINNYYGEGGGNKPTGVNPNGVTAGIGMEQTGTAFLQDLSLRALG